MAGTAKQINGLAKDVERAEQQLIRAMKGVGRVAISDVVRYGDLDDLVEIKGEVENFASQLRYLAKMSDGLSKAYEKKVEELDRAISRKD